MKKFVSIFLIVVTFAFQSNAWAVLNPVVATRADVAADLTGGVEFDGAAARVLTVTAGNSLGSTTGVNAATLLAGGGAFAGTLTFAGATTLSGNVGTAANQLLALNFNGGAGVTSNFSGTVLGAVTTSLAAATRLEINSNVTLTGALTLAAVANTILDLNSQTITQTGVYTQGAGSTLALNATSSTAFGNIQTTASNAVIGASTVDVNVLGALTSGTAMTVVNGGAGGTNGVAITVTDNSAVYTFAGSNVTGDILITPTRTNTLTALGTSTNGSSVGAALEGTAGSSTGDMLVVQNQLAMLSSAAAVDSALIQLDPEVNAGVTGTSFTALNEGLGATLGRLSEARNGGAKAGVSTGDGDLAHNVWIKGFGNFSDQDLRSGVDGYEADVWGTALGFDNLVNEYTRLGLSGGFASSDVDTKGNSNKTDIESYQGTIYGSYEPDSPWYFNGAFSFAWNEYDGQRFVAFGGVNRQADASYAGQQYSVYGDANYVIDQGDWKITPTASLQYVHLALDGYTETGADSLNLIVGGQDYDFLQSGLGAKVAWDFAGNGGTWTPEIRAKWLYDFIGDKQQTSSAFTGGGASFSTNGASPAQHSFDFGAGLTFLSANSVEVSFNYDFEIKEDFDSHSGVLMVKYSY